MKLPEIIGSIIPLFFCFFESPWKYNSIPVSILNKIDIIIFIYRSAQWSLSVRNSKSCYLLETPNHAYTYLKYEKLCEFPRFDQNLHIMQLLCMMYRQKIWDCSQKDGKYNICF